MVVWWAPSFNSSTAALTRLLLAEREQGVPADSVSLPKDDDVSRRLGTLAAASAGALVHEVVDAAPPGIPWVPEAPPRNVWA